MSRLVTNKGVVPVSVVFFGIYFVILTGSESRGDTDTRSSKSAVTYDCFGLPTVGHYLPLKFPHREIST
jgi:hypothetical protein